MDGAILYHLSSEAERAGAKFTTPRPGDSGHDIYASVAVTLFSGEQKLIPTGLVLQLPAGMVGILKDRSSVALKGLYVHAGVIDSSFRGEVQVLIRNDTGLHYHIEPGQRIAQLLVVTYHTPHIVFSTLEGLTKTERQGGAFGSTGA